MTTPKFWLVIPAAGAGNRMQAPKPKQYLFLRGSLILDLAISCVSDHLALAGCVVAISPDDPWWRETKASKDNRVSCCQGGQERADSVLSGLESLKQQASPGDWVLVHDAARPCLHPDDLNRMLTELSGHQVGGLLAAPVTDTLKRTEPGRSGVQGTVDRTHLWRALTPQMFRYGILESALKASLSSGHPVTDESSAVEQAGYFPCIVEGRPDNIKVTVPADLALADFVLSRF
jgi:2-C-methyl-D-erythritol 4-phosphate cytidylyltransferase